MVTVTGIPGMCGSGSEGPEFLSTALNSLPGDLEPEAPSPFSATQEWKYLTGRGLY